MNRKQIQDYLENECAFRDYTFRAPKQWGKVNVPRSINLLRPTKRDLDDALCTFSRDGFGTIVIYVNPSKRPKGSPRAKRTKYVYSSSSQVFHLWANQSQDSARQGGRIRRAFFDGTSCYSYGRHYEVGRIVKYNGVNVAVINTSGYSVTTGKHISEARSACRDLIPVVETGNGDLSDVRGALVEMQDDLIDRLMNKLNGRVFWPADCAIDKYTTDEYAAFNAIATNLGHPELVLNIDQDLIEVINAHIQYRIARRAELNVGAEARRAERAAKDAIKHAHEIDAWKSGTGTRTNAVSQLSPQALRIVGETVQSSQGAEVPLTDALKLLRAIETGTVKPGDQVGQFKFERLDANTQIVKIGCHRIELSEARRVLQPSTLGNVVTRSLRLVTQG